MSDEGDERDCAAYVAAHADTVGVLDIAALVQLEARLIHCETPRRIDVTDTRALRTVISSDTHRIFTDDTFLCAHVVQRLYDAMADDDDARVSVVSVIVPVFESIRHADQVHVACAVAQPAIDRQLALLSCGFRHFYEPYSDAFVGAWFSAITTETRTVQCEATVIE